MENITKRLGCISLFSIDFKSNIPSKDFLSTANLLQSALSSHPQDDASTFGPQHRNRSISQRKARCQANSPETFIQLGKTQEDLEIHILNLSNLPEKNIKQQRLKIKLLYQSYQYPEFNTLNKDTQFLCLIPLLRLRYKVPASVFKTKIQPQDLSSILESPDFPTLPNAIQALFHTQLDSKPLQKPSNIPVFQAEETSLYVYPSLTSISAGLSAKNPPTCAFQSSW